MATESTSPVTPAASAPPEASAAGGFDLGKWIAPIISLILILVIWQATVTFLRLPRFILPPPLEVLTALIANFPILLRDTWVTARATVAGFFLSMVIPDAQPAGHPAVLAGGPG